MIIRFSPAAVLLPAVSDCGSSGSGGTGCPTPPPVPDPGPPTDEVQFAELTNRTLDADGDQAGLDTYDLIRAFVSTMLKKRDQAFATRLL